MIVVGVDGSASALDAVRWAAGEALRRRQPLRLVNSWQLSAGVAGVLDSGVLDLLRDQGQRWLADARDTATAAGVHATVALTSAPVVPALVEESRAATLLVLGSRGLGGFTGLVIGSTAVGLAGRVHCPMVVVRGEQPVHGPVVVGVDGLPDSDAVLAFAFSAASAQESDVVAVHTWHDSVADTVLLGHPAPPDFELAQQRAYEALAERLAGWQEKYPDVHITREIVRDNPSRALLRYAEGTRLVVVGTRGRGGFRGLVLGSTSQQLLHHAPCPVAVVRTERNQE